MSWLIYLLEVACCHFLFWLVYRLLFHKLSSFQWNRVYLVATVLISFFIPVLEIPIYNAVDSPELYTWDWSESTNEVSHSSESVESSINWYAVIPMMILLIYLVGVLYFIIRIILSMSKVLRLIRNNEVDMKSGVQLIRIPQNTRFFSFGKWIFVSSLQAIDEQSQALILSHEKAHVDHKHTYDLILMELVSAFCWFNPFIYFIKSDLRLIHEYQADEATMSLSSDVDQYSRLMLSLACRSTSQGITHSFSKQNLKKRIMMINTQKSNAQSLWRYALVVPIVTLLLAVFSFTSVQLSPQKETGPKIRKVQWSGNTIFTDAQLNEVLGFEPGDFYDEEYFNNALNLASFSSTSI